MYIMIVVEQQQSIVETVADRFSCGHCEKTFAHKSGLNTHLKTHKGYFFIITSSY